MNICLQGKELEQTERLAKYGDVCFKILDKMERRINKNREKFHKVLEENQL